MAKDDEMSALISQATWKFVVPSPNLDVVFCRWVFTIKYRLTELLTNVKLIWLQRESLRLRVLVILRPFPQLHVLILVRCFSLWHLIKIMYQMDVKNTFLYHDMQEIVYRTTSWV